MNDSNSCNKSNFLPNLKKSSLKIRISFDFCIFLWKNKISFDKYSWFSFKLLYTSSSHKIRQLDVLKKLQMLHFFFVQFDGFWIDLLYINVFMLWKSPCNFYKWLILCMMICKLLNPFFISELFWKENLPICNVYYKNKI